MMVSDCGGECKEGRTMYFLEVERKCNGVRLRMQM